MVEFSNAAAAEAGSPALGGTSITQDRPGTAGVRLRVLWEDLKTPILVFLGIRVFLTAAVYLVLPLLPPSNIGTPWRGLPDQPLLDVWARWDSGWYASIALTGYEYSPVKPSNIAFLPVYPLAIKAVNYLVHNVWVSGILVSNLAFLAALIALFKLAKLKFGAVAARRTVFYIAIFPASFFFYSMYGESIYLLTVLLAFYLWERRKDWHGAVLGALAALTRPMGILLFLAGAAIHLGRRGRWRDFRVSWSALSLFVIPVGLASFLGYSFIAFGDPLAFLKAREVGWSEPLALIPASHRDLASSLLDGSFLRGRGPAVRLMDALSTVAFLALTIPVFRRLGPAYGLYSLGSLVMPLIVTLDGLTRYVVVIFPVFMVISTWRQRRALVIPLALLSVLLMGLLAGMFAKWYFVG